MRDHHAAPLIIYSEEEMLPLSKTEHNSSPYAVDPFCSLSMLLIMCGCDICNSAWMPC